MGLPAIAGAQTLPERVAAPTIRVVPVNQAAQVADGCGLRVTGPEGLVAVPSAPTSAGNATSCIWLIQAPDAELVSLTFNVGAGDTGTYDSVRLFAGDGEVLGTLMNVASGTALQGLPRTMVLEVQTDNPRLLQGLDVHVGSSLLQF